MKIIAKYIISGILTIGILFSPSMYLEQPQKSEALLGAGDTVFVVGDIVGVEQTIKDGAFYVKNIAGQAYLGAQATISAITASNDFLNKYVIAPMMKMLRKQLIDSIVLSMTNWINSGFKGKPLFMFNPAQIIRNMATQQLVLVKNSVLNSVNNVANSLRYANKEIAKSLILESRNQAGQLNKAVTPNIDKVIQADICASQMKIRALAQSSNVSEAQFRSTFCSSTNSEQKYNASVQCFANNFNCGGWNAFLAFTQNPANSEQNRLTEAQAALAKQIAAEQKATDDELNRGNGFYNQKECIQYYPNTGSEDQAICKEWRVTTPSQAIVSTLDQAVKNPITQLQLDDDITSALTVISTTFLNKITSMGLTAVTDTINDASNEIDKNINDLNKQLNDSINGVAPQTTTGGTVQQQYTNYFNNTNYAISSNTNPSQQIAAAVSGAYSSSNKTMLAQMQETLAGHKTAGEDAAANEMTYYNKLQASLNKINSCYLEATPYPNSVRNKANPISIYSNNGNSSETINVSSFLSEKGSLTTNKIVYLRSEIDTYQTAGNRLKQMIDIITANPTGDQSIIYKEYVDMINNGSLQLAGQEKVRAYNNDAVYTSLTADTQKAEYIYSACMAIPLTPSQSDNR